MSIESQTKVEQGKLYRLSDSRVVYMYPYTLRGVDNSGHLSGYIWSKEEGIFKYLGDFSIIGFCIGDEDLFVKELKPIVDTMFDHLHDAYVFLKENDL